jgi:hypothetical protein
VTELVESRALQALFAANGRSAVVLRRGPASCFCLIHWDLATDTFRCGQWMRGVVRLHDLSANGRWLLYWAGQYHRPAPPRLLDRLGSMRERDRQVQRVRRGHKVPRYLRPGIGPLLQRPQPTRSITTWTAISRPPYFTALALWPSLGTWTGGGGFGDDGTLVLREYGDTLPLLNAAKPPPFPVRTIGKDEAISHSSRQPGLSGTSFASDLAASLAQHGARSLHWIDEDPGTGLTFACDRRVYRADRTARLLVQPFQVARLIGDFADLAFTPVPPPDESLVW